MSIPSACDTDRYEIFVYNVKDNDIVTFRLLLLKGEINTAIRCDCRLKMTLGNKETYIPVDKSTFKGLAELKLGQNTISLKFGRSSLSLKINFELPESILYTVLPVYITCKNDNGFYQSPDLASSSPENACKKLSIVSELIQTFYAEKIFELGFTKKTFQFKEIDSESHAPICKVFKSDLDVESARTMSDLDLWKYFGDEIIQSSIGDARVKYLAVLSCTKYNGDKYNPGIIPYDFKSITDAYVALGGDGLALFGSGTMYTWPESIEDIQKCLADNTVVDRSKILDDSSYRQTYGGCFSTNLGSLCHELGHCFNLGHTENGVMGRGFDNIFCVFSPTNYQKTVNVNFKEIAKNKRFGFTKISSSKLQDFTFFNRNCGVILNSHRWLNFGLPQSGILSFDENTFKVYSSDGLSLVELRIGSSEYVENWWEFTVKSKTCNFSLPKKYHKNGKYVIFVIDVNGNTLKDYFGA